MNIKKQKRNSSAEISIPKDRLGIFQYIFRNQEHSPNARSAHSASTSSSNRRSGGSKPAFALGNLTPMHTRAIFTNTVSSPSHIHHTHSRHPSMHLMFSDSEERIVTKDNSNESDHEAVPVGIALSKSASHGPQGQGNAPEHGGIGYLREVEITVEDRSLPLPTTSTSAVRPSPRPKRSSSTALSISKGIEIMKSSWGKPSVEDDRTDPEQQLVHTRSW